MKTLMPFIVTFIIVVGISVWSCANNAKEASYPENEQPKVVYVERCQTIQEEAEPVDITIEKDRPTKEEAVRQVVALWNMYYDDQEIKKTNKRREKFQEYAEYLVDAVRLYQDTPTDIGGQLPKDKDTHLIVATMVTFESAVKPELVGKLGEVGLLQVHGRATLMGYTKKEVQRSPKLGLILGVRWLAYHTQFCHTENDVGIDKWTKTLSLYGAGINRGRYKNGKCKKIKVARRRVNLTKFYRTRLQAAANS